MAKAATRRRWTFSVRAMLIAVAIIALAVGWVANQLHWIRQRHVLMANGLILPKDLGDPHPSQRPPAGPWDIPPWPLGWFGERGVEAPSITLISVPVDEVDSIAELTRVQRLFPETTVQRWKPFGRTFRVAPQDSIFIGADRFPVG
jgi:hypothetical protein